jgi:DNA-binding transcriptional regulator YiaG
MSMSDINEIEKYRTKFGWSKAHLAREFGLHPCALTSWYNGKSDPKPIYLKYLKLLALTRVEDRPTTYEEIRKEDHESGALPVYSPYHKGNRKC